jgi:nicotinate-nucleotide--dimethylbenzimidazole phosphoribosyltransferase
MAGGAAINAIAAESGVELVLVDVGVAGDLSALPVAPLVPLRRHALRAGTANLRRESALHSAETEQALDVGARVAREIIGAGSDVIGLGEIGIGNTTAAAALIALFTGCAPSAVVGRGSGVSDAVRARKIQVVEDALALHRPSPRDPLGALSRVGGLELGAMVGAMLEAARLRVPVVLDGVVSNAAALVAQALEPRVTSYLLAGHASPEPGARLALQKLALEPVLSLDMRLGEGTGAALALRVLRTAVVTQLSMATFATAGVVGRAGTPSTRTGHG